MSSSQSTDDASGNLTSRRGHSSQLSISDPSHHVTEAIGTLYGDEDDTDWEGSRPLSFLGGLHYQERIERPQQRDQHDIPTENGEAQRQSSQSPREPQLIFSSNTGDHINLANYRTNPWLLHNQQDSSNEPGAMSPSTHTISLRNVQAQTSGSQFPLTNITNPNDIAQELSNLQALRRLSMDVGYNMDPDMPPMSLSNIPSVAPTGTDDEDDPSRLLWVPARVHPELAPSEFRSFLEKRVQSIKRRSGDSLLSAESDPLHDDRGVPGSLNRKKSMLSRQIDNIGGRGAEGYVDGAERLERQRSGRGGGPSELRIDELVQDPTKAVKKLTQETRDQLASERVIDDMPILPVAPGIGLRRSTRTTYRKGGSLRSGNKSSLSRRVTPHSRVGEYSEIGNAPTAHDPAAHSPVGQQSKSSTAPRITATTYVHTPQQEQEQSKQNVSMQSATGVSNNERLAQETCLCRGQLSCLHQDHLPIREVSNLSPTSYPIPLEGHGHLEIHSTELFPETLSSQAATSLHHEARLDQAVDDLIGQHGAAVMTSDDSPHIPPISYQRHDAIEISQNAPPSQVLNEIPSTSSVIILSEAAPLPHKMAHSPILTQDNKRIDKKARRDRETEGPGIHAKPSGAWKWFKGVADDRERKKEESKRQKSKITFDKAADSTRLDVIQASIDKSTIRDRDTLSMDRDGIDGKLQEERRKDSSRKLDLKKDKDGGIFSSLFGGSRRREEKERAAKKNQYLYVPEQAPVRPLRADLDYNWTRFPLLEERAIYRMAHIKLANPRRSLLSQVLLSNFMYSYLAIVQAMHPQMNVPVSPQQRRLEEEARNKQQQEQYLVDQHIQDEHDTQHTLGDYNFDYHRAAIQYADSESAEQVDYVEGQIYENQETRNTEEEYDYSSSDRYGQNTTEYYQYQLNNNDNRYNK